MASLSANYWLGNPYLIRIKRFYFLIARYHEVLSGMCFFLEVLQSQEEITPVKTLASCYYMLVRSPCPSTEREALISEKNKNNLFSAKIGLNVSNTILYFHRIKIENEY